MNAATSGLRKTLAAIAGSDIHTESSSVAGTVEGIFALSSEGFQDVTFCSLVPGRVVVLYRGEVHLAHGPGAPSFDRILALTVLRYDKVPSNFGQISGRKVTGGQVISTYVICCNAKLHNHRAIRQVRWFGPAPEYQVKERTFYSKVSWNISNALAVHTAYVAIVQEGRRASRPGNLERRQERRLSS